MHRSLTIEMSLILGGGASGQPERPQAHAERRVTNRVLTFSPETSAAVPEVLLSPGVPTTLIFPLNINEGATRLADPNKLIYKPQLYKNTVVLSPRAEMPAGPVPPLPL